PRLTGSPGLHKAMQWSRDTMAGWGMVNAHLEAWGTFGRGWVLQKCTVEMVEPYYLPLIAWPRAWSPSVEGTVSTAPVLLEAESDEDLQEYKGKLGGAIVLAGKPREVLPRFEPVARRYTDEVLENLVAMPPGTDPEREARIAEYRARRAAQNRRMKLLRDEGPAVILEPGLRQGGTLWVTGGGSYRQGAEPGLPRVIVAAEHYGLVARLLKRDVPVKLQVALEGRFLEDDPQAYNVLAEIPGTDEQLKDEVVMIGGHLDSWHAATGASDNAAGCAVAMEAARILTHLATKPRRTIRVVLWTGEEQGLLGSRGYVKRHFADRQTMELQPEHAKLSGYFNFDNGTGKIRGVYLQGNAAVKPIFEAWLEPFHDLGAKTLTMRNTSGTDHLAFDAVGLPGFQFIQDPIAYDTRTHHTNMDLWDHCVPDDLKQAAVIMASFAYLAATRDKMLPRKPLPEPQKTGDEEDE
ncbi:MAG: M28 family metallopeptidase, partial [Pirellulales bacterium]